MFEKMKQMMELQKQAKAMQKAMEAMVLSKESKDGKVKLSMDGTHKVTALSIDDALLAPSQRKNLEQTLSKLFNDAAEEIRQKSASQAMDMMKGMNIKLPGF